MTEGGTFPPAGTGRFFSAAAVTFFGGLFARSSSSSVDVKLDFDTFSSVLFGGIVFSWLLLVTGPFSIVSKNKIHLLRIKSIVSCYRTERLLGAVLVVGDLSSDELELDPELLLDDELLDEEEFPEDESVRVEKLC